jgi:hypothetical protein
MGLAFAVLKDAIRWRTVLLRRAESRQDHATADCLLAEIQDLAQAVYALSRPVR